MTSSTSTASTARRGAPRLFFLHGLEGTIRSHYVAGFFGEAQRRGWAADLLIFRGCGDEPNRAPRFYHSGDTGDLAFALDRVLASIRGRPIVLAGVSLGGNVLLKFLGERGDELLAASARRRGDLGSVRPGARRALHRDAVSRGSTTDTSCARCDEKARAKLARYPDLFDAGRLERAQSIYEFDDAVTAPVHGFADAHDYYSRSSSLGLASNEFGGRRFC